MLNLGGEEDSQSREGRILNLVWDNQSRGGEDIQSGGREGYLIFGGEDT